MFRVFLFLIYDLNPPGCGALFLLRGAAPACKKQTAFLLRLADFRGAGHSSLFRPQDAVAVFAPAPLRLFLPQAAPQLRSPPPIAVPPAACGRAPLWGARLPIAAPF